MKNSAIFTIFKKELARFFTDRRTLVALLMPGILIYVIYSLMGGALDGTFGTDAEYKPHIVAVNLPESVGSMINEEAVHLTNVTEDRIEDIKESVKAGGCDILAIFPADFDEAVALYQPASGTAMLLRKTLSPKEPESCSTARPAPARLTSPAASQMS